MKRRQQAISLLALAVIIAGTTWWTQRFRQPSILLITIDTLRADALGAIGGGAHTPELDRLVREGVLFTEAAAAAPTTGPSHASILSGKFPWRHGYRNNGQSLSPQTTTLATFFRSAGYRTAAFISGFPLNHVFGFEQGFEHYDDHADTPEAGKSGANERKADATTAAAVNWLQSMATESAPWFAWVHYYDPHMPYEAPAAWRQAGERGDYLAEVAYVDHWLGNLVRQARTIDPDVVIVVTSDHGEGLGDHGEPDHGLLLYESTIKVPLLVIGRGIGDSRRLDIAARSVDIAPTLLAMARLPVPTDIDGVDLRPVMRGESERVPPAYSESYFASLTYGWAPLRALRDGNAKRIEGGVAKYFDLGTDPHELHPLADSVENARLESLLALTPEPAAISSTDPVSTTAMERLRSLGYLGAGATIDATRWDDSIEPEDRLAEHRAIWTAQESLDRGNVRDAVAQFRAISQSHPTSRIAWLRLGTILMAYRQVDEGTAALQKAVDLDPLNPEAQYQLAGALTAQRRFRDAAVHWAEVVRQQPSRAVAWSNLGSVLLMDGRISDAVEALQTAVQLQPDATDLRENLARVQIQARQSTEAAATLQVLQRQTGPSFALSGLLAQQLAISGQVESAESALSNSSPQQEAYVEAHLELARYWLQRDPQRTRLHLDAIRSAGAESRILADPELRAINEPASP